LELDSDAKAQCKDKIRMIEIAQIDFSSPAQKRKHLTDSTSANDVQQTKKRMPLVSKPNEEDEDIFFTMWR